MKGADVQSTIVDAIKTQIPDHRNLADVLSEILKLHKKAVYKRLNGTTPFSLDDLCRIAKHFDFSFDRIFYPERKTFQAEFSGFSAQISALEYLNTIEKDLVALRNTEKSEVWHVTIGLPDFYLYFFEELTLFQIFNWERMVWNRKDWQGRKFKFDKKNNEKTLATSKRMANHYAQIPVVEIWNEYVLDNLLHQILYVAESNLYERKEEMMALCTAIRKLISHLKEMANSEKRFAPNGVPGMNTPLFKLYYSDTMNNNIIYLIKVGQKEFVYTVLDNPNFIKTDDTKIVEYVKNMFDRMIQRSVPLGGNGERYREQYFQKLESRFLFYEQKITTTLKNKNIPEI